MSTPDTAEGPFSRRTAWVRNVPTPLREFLSTETGGAAVLLAATIAALAWVNLDSSSYEDVWETTLSISLGDSGVELDLREWVNSGLMTFFFFVVGLEARREFDLGELRERRRFALPLLAAVGGMAMAVGIYLAFNAGEPSASGWGVAMSTETAFALGLLALFGSRVPDRLRAFILTVVVVDDLLALVVIATVYTESVDVSALFMAAALFAGVLTAKALGLRYGPFYFVLGVAIWVALLESGVEPVIVGLAMGLLAYAYPAARSDLDRAVERFRRFREQPTPELERSARRGLRFAVSPNERLEQAWHPWTSYVIVPLFALANAGIAIDAAFLERAVSSPITLGDRLRLCGRQARGHRRGGVAGHQAQPRPASPAGWLGGRRRRRDHRGYRLYPRAADREPRVHGPRARGGEARHPGRRRGRVPPHLARVPWHRPAAGGSARSHAPRHG